MKCEDPKVIFARTETSSAYQPKDFDKSYPCDNIYQFQHQDKKNSAIFPTPKIAISSIFELKCGKSFYLFISNDTNSTIEVWLCCSNDNFTSEYRGCLKLPDETKIGGLEVVRAEAVSSDTLESLHNLEIFMSCTDLSKIVDVNVNLNEFETNSPSPLSWSSISHEGFSKPMTLAANSRGTRVASVSGLCGRIYLFSRELDTSFELLSILSPSNNAMLALNSSLCFDSANNIVVSNYKKGSICKLINNEHATEVGVVAQ